MSDFFDAWVRNSKYIGEISPRPSRARVIRHNERLPFVLTWDTAIADQKRIMVRYRILGSPVALALAAWYAARLEGRLCDGSERIPRAVEALRHLGLERTHAVEALMIEDAARESLAMALSRTEIQHDRRHNQDLLECQRTCTCPRPS